MSGAGGETATTGRVEAGRSALDRLALRPLTARSVLLSVLLGAHPPELPVRLLIQSGALFDIPEGTVRVALSRMAADGDVTADRGHYRLSDRFALRQRRQDEGRAAETLEWDGTWEAVVASPGARGPAATTLMSEVLLPMRLAQWRDGMWVRPANLARSLARCTLPTGARLLRLAPFTDAPCLAGDLWDLGAWACRARLLLEAMDSDPGPALHFTVSAAVVVHLRDDPLLPEQLLPRDWPGAALRARYACFEAQLQHLLASVGVPA